MPDTSCIFRVMHRTLIIAPVFLCLFLLSFAKTEARDTKETHPSARIPILLYHRFGPAVSDSMTVTTAVFESHLKYFADKGYTVIPLRHLVDYYRRQGPPPPLRSVVITADDGHRTVYFGMFPLIKKYRIPVTLFIYPSAISNAPYAMTWEQLREMKKSGLVDVQSHSFWHPNFNRDKRGMTPGEYDKSVEMQFRKSKERLDRELGTKVDMLAWPFGIYNEDLKLKAAGAGYVAAFTMERRHSSFSENIMTLPRYLMTDENKGRLFERMLAGE